jgi:tetratricopeptide (TPR) repeat protein
MNPSEDETRRPFAVHNDLSGEVRGHVVQASSVGQINIHNEGREYPLPSQLPPAPRAFTSRARELAMLERWFAENDDQPLLVVITGAGGVGKTTLALRWLHDVRGQFPDGQLYVDLGAFSGSGPAEPSEVLEWFLLALGLPAEQVPSGLAQRAAMYRSLTIDRKVAVLLDDALSAAQVRPLLPASSSSVAVVTSRWRLTGLTMGGARFVEVNPMDITDSVELLDKVVGHSRLAGERAKAEELARLCGGMPIALAVVGARLSARPNRPLAREVGDLQSKDRLAVLSLHDELSVGVAFDMSYEALMPAEARVYRLCALHPGPVFGLDAAAAVVEQPVDHVEDALDSLVERNLVTEVADRRFRYHDLLREHALRQADPEEIRSAELRVIEWYLDAVVAADLVLRPTRRRVGPRFQRPPMSSALFSTYQETVQWLELERRSLLEAVRLADKRGWDQQVWEFCEASWGYFLHVRHYDDWLEVHALGIPAAQRCDHRVAEARLRAQLGAVLRYLRRYDDSMRESFAALRLAEHEHDDFTVAAALGELAGAAKGIGDLHGALEYLYQAKEIREVIGTARAVELCRRRIGEVLSELGRYDEAVTELSEAAAGMGKLDRLQQAIALTSLGKTYIRMGQIVDAVAALATAQEITRDLASPYLASVLAALGEIADRTGDPTAARRYYAESHEIYARNGDPKAVDLAERLARLETV